MHIIIILILIILLTIILYNRITNIETKLNIITDI